MAENMLGLKRTHYCGEVTAADVGQEVIVAGWVQRARDLGNLVFIDLRDRTGVVQLTFNDTTDRAVFEKAAGARSEDVLIARGQLRRRESVNKEIKTGEVELYVEELRVLAKSETPPFEIVDNTNVKEELRLKYSYLDLRRSEMQQALMARHRIVKIARDYFDQNGFIEVETPILVKSTPEGARDYLVPSRVHPGEFYALPQSPQLYKQLLMLAGYDRYMQIARCFRDEDLRADRQPEFTQIDLEMSFVDEEDVMTLNEGFIKKVFQEVLGVEVQTPFKRLPYDEAMERYGIDKPDTRFGLELCNLSDVLQGTDFVKTYKAKGLAFTRFTADGVSSSFEKFLTEAEVRAIHEKMGAEEGDVLLIVADKDKVVFDALGALRNHLAKLLHLYEEGTYDLLWVTDFPLFEYDEEDGRYYAMHHPFTSPKLDELDKVGL